MTVHHTVLVRGFVLGFGPISTQGGVGSVESVVAAELSIVLVELIVIAIAPVMWSFTGGVLVTVNGSDAEDSPALAASSVTETEAVVPYATRFCEIVALMDVAVPPDNIVSPEVEPFHKIWAFAAKPLPVAVSVKTAEPAAIVIGLIEVNVGVEPAAGVTLDHVLTRFAASIEPSPVAKS